MSSHWSLRQQIFNERLHYLGLPTLFLFLLIFFFPMSATLDED